jgi:hypothetical protein
MKLASTFMLCPHVFHATQGTAKAMRGCLGNKSKILWAAPAYPKDADDEKATKRAAEKALEKAAKKTAKAAESQQKADDVADVEEPTDSVIGTAEAGDTADVAMDGSDSDGE